MFGRSKPERTHTQLLTEELSESYGHLKRAAGHAAGGAAEKLTPPYDRARYVAARGWSSTRGAFTPLYKQVRQGATNARREQALARKRKSRWSSMFGLLAAGVAVGAAGALVTRRRRAAQQWESYQPTTEEPYRTEPAAGGAGATAAGPGGGQAAGGAGAGATGTGATESPPGGAGPAGAAGPSSVPDAVAEAATSRPTKPGGAPREQQPDRPRGSRPSPESGGSPPGDSSGIAGDAGGRTRAPGRPGELS